MSTRLAQRKGARGRDFYYARSFDQMCAENQIPTVDGNS